jgi:hypothetical protein
MAQNVILYRQSTHKDKTQLHRFRLEDRGANKPMLEADTNKYAFTDAVIQLTHNLQTTITERSKYQELAF